jgi:hypothetical protein
MFGAWLRRIHKAGCVRWRLTVRTAAIHDIHSTHAHLHRLIIWVIARTLAWFNEGSVAGVLFGLFVASAARLFPRLLSQAVIPRRGFIVLIAKLHISLLGK